MPTPELALVSSRLSARFDGRRLLLTAGRTTWTVPVRAIASAEIVDGGTVRVVFAGRPSGTPAHGLGDGVDIPAPNRNSAEAFHRGLARALRGVKTADDGHALVKRADRPSVFASRGFRRFLVFLWAPAVWLLVLAVFGVISPMDTAETVVALVVAGVTGGFGGFFAWVVIRRARRLWILRARGIGVVGEVTGEAMRYVGTKGGSLWIFQRLSFTTLEGERVRDVNSVVSVFGAGRRAFEFDSADLVYDPRNPALASRPISPWFLLRTALLALAAVPLVYVAVLLLAECVPV